MRNPDTDSTAASRIVESGDRLGLLRQLMDWLVCHPRLTLAALTLAALLPFLNKPFNMDDPLFIWAARHIQSHTSDPYGFEVNWYGKADPMWQVTKNPPLACYYLALWALPFGWGEIALHAAMLLPAVLVILGTHRLGTQLCKRPLLASIATLLTPVFMVSATTLMCDVMMLAFWVWATSFWISGVRKNCQWQLALAAVLTAGAALTKYFGACLIPLLVLWSLIGKHPLRRWAGWLLIPVLTLAAYHFWTRSLYGVSLLTDAADYASTARAMPGETMLTTVVTALAFTGGCCAILMLLSPGLWQRTGLMVGTGLMAIMAGPLYVSFSQISTVGGTSAPLLAAQLAFWATGGIGMVCLACSELRQVRDAAAWLLAAWVLGTVIFAGFLNWVVNARSILPLAPAMGLLIARRLDQRAATGGPVRNPSLIIALGVGGLLAVWVTAADSRLAWAVRETARQVQTQYRGDKGMIWFLGHWGFQYYMQTHGAKPLNVEQPGFKTGDLVVMPFNNTNVRPLEEEISTELNTLRVQGPEWISTLGLSVGAGFYASLSGPLPFAVGRVWPEGASIHRIVSPSRDAPQLE